MNVLLSKVATLVERAPVAALAALLALTVILGSFATQQETDTDLTAFAPESDLAAANERIGEAFAQSGASIQVMIDAGEGGDVLSPDGLQVAQQITDLATGTPEVTAILSPDSPEAPAVVTYALPFAGALAQQGIDPAAADDATIDAIAAGVLADPAAGAQAGALLSDDLDVDGGTARAGLVILQLDAGVAPADQATGELAFRDALLDADLGELTASAFSENIFADQLLTDIETEMPILLGFSFLLIIAILLITYRRVSDVLLGLGGLVITIVWTYGIAVLMGPNYLGITGVMSQISLMIPVLLIGLAIDYAIHLTSRYREDLAKGAAPATAARGAITSVGGALVLATITTMVGFLTNVVSPLPPMRDFGLFVAGGVLSAFIVMVLLVPATRSLLDRRRADRGTLSVPQAGEPRGMEKVMARAAVLSERHAVPTLAVAVVVTVLAGIAGTQVSTTFSQDDFVPADSEIGQTIATMQDLFGGDLDETTSVLIDGNVATPEAANAMLAAQAEMADTPSVRTAGGQVQVTSPAGVIAALAADPQLAEQMAALGFSGEGFGTDADVSALYDLGWQVAPQQLASVLTPEADTARLSIATTAGQDGAGALRDALQADVAVLAEAGLTTTIVSESLIFEESLDALTSSQTSGIIITLIVALIVLVGFFTVRDRRPLLGVITMIPSALVVAWVAGSMWALGLSFNVMTAMVASLAIGIGVPYGIHITNRFTEDLERHPSIDEAVRHTVTHTGGALLGSASTTAAGFGVLAFASLVPMQQFGIITALTIVYSLIGAVLIEPACLKLWAQWRLGRHDAPTGSGDDEAEAPAREPVSAG